LEQLYKYKKLPIKIKAVKEATKLKISVPILTIENTEP
jgi:hypothetical protein